MILDYKTIDLYNKPLFTCCTIKTPNREAPPFPSEACFLYITDGSIEANLGDYELKVEKGEVILSLCGYTVGKMIHEQKTGQFSSFVVHFHKDILLKVFEHEAPTFWEELQTPVTKYIVTSAASQLVKSYFLGIEDLFKYRIAISEEMLVLKLKEIILLLLKTENAPEIKQLISSLFSQRTFSFKEVIEANIYNPIAIEQLAQLTNQSLSSFKREFKKIYNTTPGQYILNRRAEKVAKLLQVSDESISNIGFQCGFTNPAHLSRVFKSKYGVSPSDYRLTLSVK